MRFHINTSGTREVLPFNYQPILTGALHKWLGNNNDHDSISLYSFSWLSGGEAVKNGLKFKNGASFFISSTDNEFLKSLYHGITKDPTIASGLKVISIDIQQNPVFENNSVFYVASPVLIKRKVGERIKHFTFKEKESDTYLTETFKTKLKEAGLSVEGVDIQFERNYLNPKTKLVHYKGIGNKVNICPVRISGSPEQIAFAWNVGVGNSTGIGFGSLK